MNFESYTLSLALQIGASLPGGRSGYALEYGPDSKMILPKDYREWVFLSSGLGMSYTQSATPNPNPGFDNDVRQSGSVPGKYLKTGAWPIRTVLILEACTRQDGQQSVHQ